MDRRVELDYYERAVFEDLSRAVAARPREQDDVHVGLFRPCAESSTDAGRIERVLATVAVFVALRSECYDTDETATAEQAVFLRQPAATHPRAPRHRLLPVLWEVPPGGAAWATRDAARTLLPDVPQYAETGLAALSRRHWDRAAYERVLAFLGDWIVELAEGRHTVVDTRWPEPPPRAARPAFVIATLAVPQASGSGDGGRPAAGDLRDDRLREVAVQVAECVNRSRFDVRTVDVSRGPGRLGERPGVLLVDERNLGTPEGRSRVRQLLGSVPDWMQPLLVPTGGEPVRVPAEDVWGARPARPAARHRLPRPRIMTEPDDPLAVITAAIDRATRHFDDEHLVERRYPPRPRSNSHPEE
ncbi:hypothetical protein [Micromonospora phaseoli]|uniref:hypothetical protein n=1 Tax=Micromonospora phaseoli TaxID=1144548 RepID=UPI000B816FA0|nr:hypothetical protein [Micromonospora phaseoli]